MRGSVHFLKSHPRPARVLLVLPLLACLPGSLFACQYTVRDVGFVDTNPVPYRLCLFAGKDTPPELATSFRQAAGSALARSNVVPEVISVESQPDHPAMAYLKTPPSGGGPAAILVSPENDVLTIPLPGTDATGEEDLRRTLEGVVVSPIREEILDHIISSYGVVVMAEGTSETQNRQASEMIADVLNQIEVSMATAPKPVGASPCVLVVKKSDFDREKVLLWSLGIEGFEEEPQAAVLFGRARKIGGVLRGGDLSKDRLMEVLSVIGLDCECGLDRSWMEGTRIPLRWDSSVQAKASKSLGFDAENPMARMEITQILTRGPSFATSKSSGPGAGEDPLLGYSEQVFTAKGEPVEEQSVAAGHPSERDPPPAQRGPERVVAEPLVARSMPVQSAGPGASLAIPLVLVAALCSSLLAAGCVILLRARWRVP